MNTYIPADKLLAEIERYKQGAAIARFDNAGDNADYFQGKVDLCDDLTHIITSLRQEQQTKGYDEAYLNECIAKARKTWKGVDVDKYMDEMRGREQEQPEVDLEKLGEIARHLIAVKDHEEDMRLSEDEWLLLNRIGYPERFNARKEESK